MAKFKKKPTIKEVASVTIEINQKVNEIAQGLDEAYAIIRQLDSVIGMYVDMNGHNEKFTKFIQEKVNQWKESQNDSKGNGDADKPNLQEDTKGKSSGAKRVRKKAK